MAGMEKLKLRLFDIMTASLYGDLQEEIYMLQSTSHEDGSNKVVHLQRSLYGLKQAQICWNKRFKDFLNTFGLQSSETDGVYIQNY